jgi:2-keto-4-pentenoate hydratase
MHDEIVQDIAIRLQRAEENHESIPRLTSEFPRIDYSEARSIARARDQLRRRSGQTRIGYKLGWTSAAMRTVFGITRPNWGTLWSGMQLSSTCSAKKFVHAKAEPEIAFVVGRPLGGQVDAGQVLESDGRWALAIEIVDPRWPDYEFTFEENTADNSSAAAFVLGKEFTVDRDPSTIDVLFESIEEQSRGRGANAMESPAQAVAWLCQQLSDEGSLLEQGDVILTGGLTAPVDVYHGQKLRLRSEELGSVSIDFVA